MPARSRVPLVALLGGALGAELLIRRLLGPLLHLALLTPAGTLRDTVGFAGLFLYHFSAVLGVLVALGALGRLVLFPSVIPRGAKAAVAALAVAFLPLLVARIGRPLPGALGVYLEASFACLVALLLLGGWVLRDVPPRARLGLLVAALPILLRLGGTLAPGLAPGTEWPARLSWASEVAAIAAGAGVLACFLPRRPRLAGPLLVALPATAAAAAVVFGDWELGARIAAYGFGVQLPPSPPAALLLVASFGAWVFAVAALVGLPGPQRLRGYGVALVGLAGLQLSEAHLMAGSLVGFLCLVESLDRSRRPAPSAADWRDLVKQLAAGLGAANVEMAGREGYETARVFLTHGGDAPAPVEVAIGREAGLLAHAEVVVGHAPSEEAPPVSLARRGATKLGRTRGDEVATGDLAFDEAFRIWDARRLTDRDRVLDDDLRPRLVEHLDGWLAVWPGAGVRYRTRNTGALDGRLVGLIDLLVDLKNRS